MTMHGQQHAGRSFFDWGKFILPSLLFLSSSCHLISSFLNTLSNSSTTLVNFHKRMDRIMEIIDQIFRMTTIQTLIKMARECKSKTVKLLATDRHVHAIRTSLLSYVENHRRLLVTRSRKPPLIVFVGPPNSRLPRLMNRLFEKLMLRPSRFTAKKGMTIVCRLFRYLTYHRVRRLSMQSYINEARTFRHNPFKRPIQPWTPHDHNRNI